MTENQKLREALRRIKHEAASLADAQVIALEALSLPTQAEPVEGGEVPCFPINGKVWFRESTNEWVLELSGVINDTNFTVRHTCPPDTKPEDVVDLPNLYPPASQEHAREHFMAGYAAAEEDAAVCQVPPLGWHCTRKAGHDGPCAAVPTDDAELVQRGMDRLRAASQDHAEPAAQDHIPDTGKMIETAAPVGDRLTLSAEDVHAAFVKHFPKTRISQAWIGFAAEIAEAIAARAARAKEKP